MHRIMFKSLLIKIYLNLIIARFLNCDISEIYNYKVKVARRFLYIKREKIIINVINR